MSARGNAWRYSYVPPAESANRILRLTTEMDGFDEGEPSAIAFCARAHRLYDLQEAAEPKLFDGNFAEVWPFAVPGSLDNVDEELRYSGGGYHSDLYARLSWPLGTAWECDNHVFCLGLLTEEDVVVNDWVPFRWLSASARPMLLDSMPLDAMTKLRLAVRWAAADQTAMTSAKCA